MKILMVRPMEHPIEMDIPDTLEAMYKELDCRTITAVYPWKEPIALVTDDEGILAGKQPNRFIPELGQPIMGSFFLCGFGEDSFTDLPDILLQKYKKRFWNPEIVVQTASGLIVLPVEG